MITSRKQTINWIKVGEILFQYITANPLKNINDIKDYFLNRYWHTICPKLFKDAKYDFLNNRYVKNQTCSNQCKDEAIEETLISTEDATWYEIKYEWWQLKTRDEFLKHINFDDSIQEIISYQTNVREVVIRTWKNESTLVKKYEHFLRTKPSWWFNIDRLISSLEDKLSWFRAPLSPINVRESWKALQICLFDAHINKKPFSWWEWNCEIARETYLNMVNEMCIKAKNIYDYEECVLVIGNDFLNSDMHARTTSWTPQDNVEWEESSFEYWLNIIIDAVAIINKILKCKIYIISMPWNHAETLETVMWVALWAIYRWNHTISVDCKKEYRKYWVYWNSAVMFTHGDGAKKDSLPMIFANEKSDIWSTCKYKECHLGHIHTQMVHELNWVIIRYLSSTTTTDKWHNKMWYVWNIRWWQMFIFDKEKWNEAQFNFYV